MTQHPAENPIEDELQKALAAFGDDLLDLLDDDDDDFQELVDPQPAEATRLIPPRIQELIDLYGDQINEETRMSYAGSVALACSQAAHNNSRQSTRHLIFAIGEVQFGLPLESVSEIARSGEITPLPRTDDWLIGVTNLRGTICPVARFSSLLQVKIPLDPTAQKIIVVHDHSANQRSTAIVVNRVLGIRNVEVVHDSDSTDPHSNAGGETISRLACGIAESQGHPVILVDPDKLLSCPELSTYCS